MTIGLAPAFHSIELFSLTAKLARPRSLIFADCAVNAEPTAEELAAIAIASAEKRRRVLGEDAARRAALVFDQGQRQASRMRTRSCRALALARAQAPGSPSTASCRPTRRCRRRWRAKKVKSRAPVAGQANVLVFPDLDAGNIAYKLTQ